MKILNKLTVTSLKLNKKRTLVTAIGIILSTALITVVAGMVTSARGTLKEYSRVSYGDYHVAFENVPISELSYIEENRNIENYFLSSNLGYAPLKGSTNEFKPYVYVTAYDSVGLNKMPLNIKEGRKPENSNELMISSSIISNGEVELKIGDKISLDISKRFLEEKELSQQDIYTGEEYTEKLYTKEYTIVGIMERLNMDLEPYSAPGYSVVTFLDTNNLGNMANIYTTYTKKALKEYKDVTNSILGLNIEKEKNEGYPTLDRIQSAEDVETQYTVRTNTSLLNFEGVGLNNAYTNMLYMVASIVIVIIIISSVFVIRNSFAISITERTRQYGMIASIGATKKQIKKNVLFEGVVLGSISIPLGILLGMFVNLILSVVLNKLMSNVAEELNFIYEVPIMAIIFSIILAGITIYFSCLSSARRAAKVSPIDAIRSSDDIKIKSKKVKSPKIIKKIFGVGGDIAYKNLKRSKKKYRTTVISIVVSIMIFISVTSLVQYGFKVSSASYKDVKYNISMYANEKNTDSAYENYRQIAKMDLVKEYSISRTTTGGIKTSNVKFTKEGKNYLGYDNENSVIEIPETTWIQLIAVGEEEYQRYIKDLDLSYDKAKDKGILIDDFTGYIYNSDGSYKKQLGNIYDYKVGEKITLQELGTDSKGVADIEIVAKTNKRPMGCENIVRSEGFIIVSDEFIDKYKPYFGELYINAKDATKLEAEVKKNYKDISTFNIEAEVKSQNSMILIIAIFLYGFIIVITLIGITNIFNTITSNMNLRSKEFANLKSIGMTKKEFNRMIRLESIFYGSKSIIIGVPLGVLGSYLLYKAFEEGISMGNFNLPIMPILIAIIAVFLLIGTIMKYSLNKINKQNIIETIRKDNI